ncbi:MAG: hypothetical protein F4X62_04130 [Caldilineaceae bacterium SB0662_bin_25]|nr:hypothetical protein [Caldilineaceae bacterium SB0662_bin_25]
MILQGGYQDLGDAVMPEWKGRQSCLFRFDPVAPVMEAGFEDYVDVVSNLVHAANPETREAYMAVDERMVEPLTGQCCAGGQAAGRDSGREQVWHQYEPGRGYYFDGTMLERMAVIVIANVSGCIVCPGAFHGEAGEDGEAHVLAANRGYLLSPECVRGSKVFLDRSVRSFLRITFETGTAVVSSQ